MIKNKALTAVYAEAQQNEDIIKIAVEQTAEVIIEMIEDEADHYDALNMPDKAVALRNLAAELRKDFA